MEAMRDSWSDERLDDLNGKVDRGFGRIDGELRAQRVETRTEFVVVRSEMKDEFAAVRAEMKAGFDKVDDRFERMDARFDRIEERFEGLHRLMVQFCGLMLAAVIGLAASCEPMQRSPSR